MRESEPCDRASCWGCGAPLAAAAEVIEPVAGVTGPDAVDGLLPQNATPDRSPSRLRRARVGRLCTGGSELGGDSSRVVVTAAGSTLGWAPVPGGRGADVSWLSHERAVPGAASSPVITCECGKANRGDRASCWGCGAPLAAAAEVIEPEAGMTGPGTLAGAPVRTDPRVSGGAGAQVSAGARERPGVGATSTSPKITEGAVVVPPPENIAVLSQMGLPVNAKAIADLQMRSSS